MYNPQMNGNTQMNLTETSAFSPGMTPAFYPSLSKEAKELFESFWVKTYEKISNDDDIDHIKVSMLPLARIKKIIKMDEDVQMISSEVPVLFSKAAEIFIQELSIRAWIHTEESRRRTIQRNDISMAVARNEQFDFLIDVVPREDSINCSKDNSRPPDSTTDSDAGASSQNSTNNSTGYNGPKFISTSVIQMVPTSSRAPQIPNMYGATANSLVNLNVAQPHTKNGHQVLGSYTTHNNNMITIANNLPYNINQHAQQQILGQNIRYLTSPTYPNEIQPVPIGAQFAIGTNNGGHLTRTLITNGNSNQQNIMQLGLPMPTHNSNSNNMPANVIATTTNLARPATYISMNNCFSQNNQHLMSTTNLPYHIVPAYLSQTSNMPLQLPSTVERGRSQGGNSTTDEEEDKDKESTLF